MSRALALFKDFAADCRGATAIEYALVGGLVSISIVTAATQLGTSVGGLFQAVVDGFTK